jgi:glycosyltransferase involved in cell wall biosynthesis
VTRAFKGRAMPEFLQGHRLSARFRDRSLDEGTGRVAVVGSVAIFTERTGRAAYLASFCRLLRGLGFHVDLLFLNGIAGGRLQLRLYPDYLDSVDAVALRGSVRIGARFVAASSERWVHGTMRSAASVLDFSGSHQPDETIRSAVWHMAWPGKEALEWARRRLARLAPDIVVANYFNASRVFDCVDPGCLKAILVHDVFALRRQSYAASGYPLDFDERMIAAEAESFAAADLCIAITPTDAEFIRSQHPGVRTVTLPHVVQIPAEAKRGASQRCLFVASDNEPNRRGLAWLLREVWPLVVRQNPEIELRVVGNIQVDEGLPRPAEVTFAGVVDNLAEEYLSTAVALVPLRAGSGLKVKLIEALAHGVPVVSTLVGAEGVDVASSGFLRIRDDPKDFAEAIIALADLSAWAKRSAEATTFARERYSEEALRAVLEKALALPAKDFRRTHRLGGDSRV